MADRKILKTISVKNLTEKLVAFVFLIYFNINIFTEIVSDPVSIGKLILHWCKVADIPSCTERQE